MFLALVVTPELREFLARARCGAVRLIKVCIQEGEWTPGLRSQTLPLGPVEPLCLTQGLWSSQGDGHFCFVPRQPPTEALWAFKPLIWLLSE